MKKHIFTLILLALGFVSQAATFTWTGSAGDNRWRNRVNWDLNAVPGTFDDVVIATAGSYPVITSRQFINQLTIDAGASCTVGAGGWLYMGGDFTNNGTINLVSGGTFRCMLFTNTGTANVTGGLVEYNKPQDINKGFNYGNLWLNATYDVFGDFFIASGDVNVYGNLKIGGVTDYLGFYYGTVFSPFSNTIHCQNLQNYGLAYDIFAISYSLPVGTISLENMVGANNSRLMGISPFLYQNYSISGTQFEGINLVCQNSATRIDDYLFIDAVIGTPVSTFDFAAGNTVLYSGIYSVGLDFKTSGSGKMNQYATNTQAINLYGNSSSLTLGSINNLNVVSGSTTLNGGVIRNSLYCSVPVTCGSFNHTFGMASSDVFNGALNLVFAGSGGGVTLLGTSGSTVVTAEGSYTTLQVKRANGISLSNNMNIASSLRTLGGSINLNGYDINLAPGSSLTETSGNLIWSPTTGAVRTYSYFGYTPSNENVCNIGIKLSMDADPGYTTIARYPIITNANSQVSISRKFEIVTTNAVNITNTRVYYDDLELNGNNESSASFDVKTSTNGGTSWSDNSSTNNATFNWVYTANAVSTSTPLLFTVCDNSNFMKPVKTAKIRTTESGVFPNPFTNSLNWNIKTESEDVVNVQLFDLSGKCVYQQTQTLFEGNNRITLEGLDELAQGTYVFVATGNNTLVQSKVVKF